MISPYSAPSHHLFDTPSTLFLIIYHPRSNKPDRLLTVWGLLCTHESDISPWLHLFGIKETQFLSWGWSKLGYWWGNSTFDSPLCWQSLLSAWRLSIVEDQRGRVGRLELLTREEYRIEPIYLGLLDRTILHLVGDSGDCWSRLYRK